MDSNLLTKKAVERWIEDLAVRGLLVADYPEDEVGNYDHIWFGSMEGETGWIGVIENMEDEIIGYEPDEYDPETDTWIPGEPIYGPVFQGYEAVRILS